MEPLPTNGSRNCHDCDTEVEYGRWLELRCTLDNEDVTQTYCLPCFVNRMGRYVDRMRDRLSKVLSVIQFGELIPGVVLGDDAAGTPMDVLVDLAHERLSILDKDNPALKEWRRRMTGQ